jgi:hypothetical protein
VWAAANIAQGQLVTLTGSAGAYVAAGPADNTTSDNVAGIALEAIDASTLGNIQVDGTIQAAWVNTNGMTAGAPLYLGTAGGFTTSRPANGVANIRIGIVGVPASSNGSIVLGTPSFESEAVDTKYDNTDSALDAENVKAALDELDGLKVSSSDGSVLDVVEVAELPVSPVATTLYLIPEGS